MTHRLWEEVLSDISSSARQKIAYIAVLEIVFDVSKESVKYAWHLNGVAIPSKDLPYNASCSSHGDHLHKAFQQ